MKSYLLLVLMALPLWGIAQPTPLLIKGQASIEVTPDITVLNLSIESESKDYEACTQSSQKKGHDLKEYLLKQGITAEQIVKEHFSIDKVYSYASSKRTFAAHRSTFTITLEIKDQLILVEKVINKLNTSGVDAQLSIWHKLSNEQEEKTNDELIIKAIADAKHKAELISKSLDQKLDGLVSIEYGTTNKGHQPIMEHRTMMMSKASSDKVISITPSPISRSTDITIEWRILPAS